MTLADHAEAWWKEHGRKVPPRNTAEYTEMYEKWHAFAFRDLRVTKEGTDDVHVQDVPLLATRRCR